MLKPLTHLARHTWKVHAGYNLVGGIWPLVHLPSFEAITGPKVDRWLVRTVGALVAVNGAAIASAGQRDQITPEITAMAIGTSASLAVVDVIYVSKGRISPVYLLDALAEVVLIGGWVLRERQAGIS